MKHLIGKGWWDLLDECISRLEEMGVKIIEPPSEKYGRIRIYVDNYTDEVIKLLGEIEDRSAEICEECGKEGEIKELKQLRKELEGGI